jgi:hypothetical protein
MIRYIKKIIRWFISFFHKEEIEKDLYAYLGYYKCVVDDSINRSTLTDAQANLYIVNFFKSRGKKPLYYQIQEILGDYYVFFGSEVAINKHIYCMMLLLLVQIKKEDYHGADEKYLYKEETINNQKIKIFRSK